MRVVRAGGEYLVGRERRLWLGLAVAGGVVVAGGGVAVLTHGTVLTWGGLLGGGCAVSVGIRIRNRLASVRKGRLGERLVTHLLCRLPDDYSLVNDVMLPNGRGNIDHVLVGPCGVVVIETKRIAGRIRCWGDEWSVNGFRRTSFSRQANSGATGLRYFLAERRPDLAPRWVDSVVVFTHPLCRVDVNHATTTVVRFSELLEVVLELSRKHHMAPHVAARIADFLATAGP